MKILKLYLQNFSLLITLFFSANLSAQTMMFNSAVLKLKKGMEDNFVDAHEILLSDAKFTSGSQIAIERILKGHKNGAIFRTVWVMPAEGDMIEGISQDKWDAYWAKMGDCIIEYTEHSAGRFLFGQGRPKKGDVIHIWDFKATNQNQFKTAQEKMLKELQKEFDGRFIAFGTYDINKPDGATHWAAVSGKSEGDHIMLLEKLEKTKAFYEFIESRGTVEDIRDYETWLFELYE